MAGEDNVPMTATEALLKYDELMTRQPNYMTMHIHRTHIAYHILIHECLMAVSAASTHTPISLEEFKFMIIEGMKKAAGELS